MPAWLNQLAPIAILLGAVGVVVWRLPRVHAVDHSPAYRRRRALNWMLAGLTYSFLYFGRYNLTAFKNAAGMSHEAYGTIDMWGSIVYGLAFLLNGPLTDVWGGRRTLIISAVGAAFSNVALGILVTGGWSDEHTASFVVLYAVNMYFQSFGAAAIVKVNSAWFHLRERGTFGGIFGILISLGIYFAYDWGRRITEAFPGEAEWVFFIPPFFLIVAAGLDVLFVRDTPAAAGHKDFDTADASSREDGPRLPVFVLARRMLTHPVILTIALIEFCSGFLRQAIMKWYPVYAKGTGITGGFVYQNWGLLLCVAGILGGVVAGTISDQLFASRRGPVSSLLYGGLLAGIAVMWASSTSMTLEWAVVFMSLCVIGVHGMLSGTASMDFGGSRNVGVAVGIIDGCVYLGTATQAFLLKTYLPDGAAQADAAAWRPWPLLMLPVALIGFLLATRVWNASVRHAPAATPVEPSASNLRAG